MRKAGSASEIPPPLELLCLKALWSLQEGNVNDVRRVVSDTKALAYTTVMTLLERLARKGVVVRRKVGRAYVYMPQTSRDAVRRLALKEFLDCHFEGSEQEFLAFLQDQDGKGRMPEARAAAPADSDLDTALL